MSAEVQKTFWKTKFDNTKDYVFSFFPYWPSLENRPPITNPEPRCEPSFDPMLGFANGRKERVPTASREEMSDGKLPLDLRDYCASSAFEYLICQREKPFTKVFGACAHEQHVYHTCQYEDVLLRHKEWERERRLRLRQKRRIEMGLEIGEGVDEREIVDFSKNRWPFK